MSTTPAPEDRRDDDSPETDLSRPGVIDAATYEDGVRVANVRIDGIRDWLAEPDGVTRFAWVGLHEPGPDLLRDVQREFDLHELAIEDAHRAHQRPKIEPYADSLFVVLRTCALAPPEAGRRLEFGETHLFVGHNYVVTVRHGSLASHRGVRVRCEGMPKRLALGPGFVLYSVMDFVVDQYFPIIEVLEEDLDRIEDTVFQDQPSRRNAREIHRLMRDLIAVKHAIFPLTEVCNRLTRVDLDLIPDEVNPYFRDVHDHVLHLNERIDNVRQLLASALDANVALLTEHHTVHTKRLAAWAAILAVPTLAASIYGMNFVHMPELGWRFGYPLAVAAMFGASAGLYVAFRRSGWL